MTRKKTRPAAPCPLEGGRAYYGTPTWYRDVRFRSRLEASWAAAFDGVGLRWSYEPARYYFGCHSYLPDFWLPHLQAYAEVKPVTPSFKEFFFGKCLCGESACPVYFLIGPPADAVCGGYFPTPPGSWPSVLYRNLPHILTGVRAQEEKNGPVG